METEKLEAVKRLEAIKKAQNAAQRNSPNNGTIPLVWGVLIIIGLATFDVFPGPVAGIVWGGIAAVAGVWTAVYGSRLRVQPRKVRNPFIWMIFYYPILLIAAILLFPNKPPFMFTIVGVLTALPILWAGLQMRQQSREN
jgi:hypothetical protein